MPRLRIGRSYWLDADRRHAQRFPTLGRRRVSADVAIVGGGITGCSAALLFAKAGARVVLLDAARIGRGSTAASTALLMQEPDADFRQIAARYGAAKTGRIWRCSRRAVEDFTEFLRDAGHDLVHSLPSVYYAADDRGLAALRVEHRLRRRARLGGRWLDASEVRAIAGLDAPAAILTRGNAQTDPYAACLAIARAASDAGVSLHEHARVSRIVRDGSTAAVELANGPTIHADWAIVATGYATPEFERLTARFRMMNTYVIVTRRLTRAERQRIGLGDAMLWDTRRPYHYLRWSPDGRLILGGRDRPHLHGAARRRSLRRRAAELIDDLVELYPALRGIRAEYAWEGLFATTPDGLPYIGQHRLHPRQLFALGYGGNGMTLGFFGAQAVVRLAQGRPAPDDALFGFRRGT